MLVRIGREIPNADVGKGTPRVREQPSFSPSTVRIGCLDGTHPTSWSVLLTLFVPRVRAFLASSVRSLLPTYFTLHSMLLSRLV